MIAFHLAFQRIAFRNQGYIILRSFFNNNETTKIKTLQDAFNALMGKQ